MIEYGLICVVIIIVTIYGVKIIMSIINKIEIDNEIKRVSYNNELLNSINHIIQLEIVNKVKLAYMLNEKYTVRNFDRDIEEISIKVFNAFKDDIFINDKNILKNNYIFHYIVNQTILIYFEFVKTDDNTN